MKFSHFPGHLMQLFQNLKLSFSSQVSRGYMGYRTIERVVSNSNRLRETNEIRFWNVHVQKVKKGLRKFSHIWLCSRDIEQFSYECSYPLGR